MQYYLTFFKLFVIQPYITQHKLRKNACVFLKFRLKLFEFSQLKKNHLFLQDFELTAQIAFHRKHIRPIRESTVEDAFGGGCPSSGVSSFSHQVTPGGGFCLSCSYSALMRVREMKHSGGFHLLRKRTYPSSSTQSLSGKSLT